MVITTTLRSAFAIGFSLAVLMAATCSHHFATALHVPDASWAVFFVAGFYLRPLWTFPALLALAGVSDYVAITSFGVSDFCMSPAYGFLLPAYGSLWFAGRWYAARHRFTFSHAGPVGGQSVPGRGGMRVDLERRLLFLLGAVCGNQPHRVRLAAREVFPALFGEPGLLDGDRHRSAYRIHLARQQLHSYTPPERAG